MQLWYSSSIRKEVVAIRDKWKPKVKRTRITTNKHKVHILKIDEKSARKYSNDKFKVR